MVVCLLGVVLSSLSVSYLYQAYLSHTMAIFCVKKEQMIKLVEGAHVYAIARYQHSDKKIRTLLKSKKTAAIEYEAPLFLENKAVRITILYKVSGSTLSIDTLVLCGDMRERIVRTYVY